MNLEFSSKCFKGISYGLNNRIEEVETSDGLEVVGGAEGGFDTKSLPSACRYLFVYYIIQKYF